MAPIFKPADFQSRIAAHYRQFSWLASLVVAILGVLAIFGWLLDIDWLTGAIGDRVTMKLSTAVGMVAGGGSLALYHGQRQRWAKKRWARQGMMAGGLLLLLLGTLTLLRYGAVLPEILGFITDSPDLLEDLATGIMAPNTAVNFVLSGGSLLLLARRQYLWSRLLGYGVFLIAEAAFVGHLYGALLLYDVGSITGMAVNTSLGFLLLGAGLILSAPDQGWLRDLSSSQLGGMMLRWLLPVALLLPVMMGWLVLWLADVFPTSIEETAAIRSVATGALFASLLGWTAHRLNQTERDRQRMQQQLALREHQLQAIFNNAFQFIGLLSPDGTLLEVNQTALDFAGLPRSQVVNRPFWEARWWSLSEETQERLKQAIATAAQGEFVRYEVEVAGAGDRTIIIDFSLQPVFDADRRVVQIIPEGRNITAQYRLRQQLEETQAQLTAAQQIARIGSWELDVATQQINWSPQLFEIYGLDPDQGIPAYEEILQMIMPQDREQIQGRVEQAMAQGVAYRADFGFIRPSGEVISVEARGEAVRDRDGQIVKLVGTALDITDRKRAELALRQSQNRYMAIVEDQNELVCRFLPDTTVLFVNSAFCRYFSVAYDEIVNHSYNPIIHPDDRQYVAEQLTQLSLENPTVIIENRVFCHGEVRWTEWNTHGLYDQHGRLVEFQTVGRDTTERKLAELALQESNENLEELVERRNTAYRHALGQVATEIEQRRLVEKALQESEAQLKLAVAVSPFPILVHAEDGSILQVSQGWLELTGYRIQELRTINDWVERAYAERSNEVKAQIQTLYQLKHKVKEGEYPIRTRDGEIRIWDFSSVPLGRLSDGRRIVMSIAADVTDRKLAEAQLNRRLEQQAALVYLGRVALSQTDDLPSIFQLMTQEISRCLGAEYCKILELLPEEPVLIMRAGVGWQPGIVGKAKVAANDNSQAGYTLQQSEPVIVTNLATETRFQGPALLTSHQVASGISMVIPGTGDQPFGVLGVHSQRPIEFSQEDGHFVQAMANLIADAIARQRSEDQIRQFNETLEQQVEERTQQLEEANQELRAFSYSVSHDLRAPLRAIEGFAQILQEDYHHVLDEPGLDYTRRLINAASHLDHLIQDLLSYSRMGRQELRLTPVNLEQTLSAIQQDSINAEHPSAHMTIASPLPEVMAHPLALKQILANIISNAVKFVAAGSTPDIKIWAESRDPWVYLYIQDNGIGIAPEHQERIFRPFERLHGIEAYPGTGIGLAIVRRGVERMGGEVGLTSNSGQGACFWLKLPAVIASAAHC